MSVPGVVRAGMLAAGVVLGLATAIGQQQGAAADSAGQAAKQAYFVTAYDPQLTLELEHVVPTPPADGSAAAAAELAEVRRVEKARSAEEVREAKFDDAHEDVFVFAGTVLDATGKPAATSFDAAKLPLLGAFAAHLRADASLVNGPLKGYFKRLRPYNYDHSLHPVCATNTGFSYPSGHSINGYLYGYLLAAVLPEESDRLLARAEGYAHNRVVCGVHYPADTEASRRVASVVFGYMLGQPKFVSELDAVRSEVRGRLGFSVKPGE